MVLATREINKKCLKIKKNKQKTVKDQDVLVCESGNAGEPFKRELHSLASSFPWASEERLGQRVDQRKSLLVVQAAREFGARSL